MDGTLRPFTIEIADEVLTDLRRRVSATRWPTPAPGAAWSQGTDLAYLRDVMSFWAAEFDWRAAERRLNEFAHFVLPLSGMDVHFVYHRAVGGKGTPLLLTHGWPSSFVELLPLVGPLTDPASHGLPGPGFDVVIPSLPGYGFSTRPARPHTMRDTADVWHRLMATLGYRRYGAHGGDFGAGVSTFLALDRPGAVLGLHLSNLELDPYLGPDAPPLTEDERALMEAEARFADREGGYHAIQSTKPQTLGYGLSDSPSGLAAWVLEKWRAWSDCAGNLDSRFSRDFLLTTLTLMWATNTITDSMRDFHDNRGLYDVLTATDRVRVPTAIALFDNEFAHTGSVPRSWAERLYDVHRWTVMPSGGHFAAVEEPAALAEDIIVFFGGLVR